MSDAFTACTPSIFEVSGGMMTIFYAAPPFSEPIGDILEVNLYYTGESGSGLGGADLTDGGASDRFIVEVTDFVSETCGPHWFRIHVGGSLATGDSLFTNAILVDAPGTYEYLFSDMLVFGNGADLAAAEEILVAIAVNGKCIEPSAPNNLSP